MKRLLILLLIFIAGFQTLQAQTRIYYNIVHNDPYDLKKVRLFIDPAFIALYMKQLPIGGGLQLNYSPHYRINFEAQFRVAYYDKQLKEAKKNALNTNKFFPYSELEALTELHLKDKRVYNNVKITLARASFYTYTLERYINVSVEARKIIAFRGGYFRYSLVVDGGDGYPLKAGSTEYNSDYYTVYASQGFFVGFSSGSINKYRIKLRDYNWYTARFRKYEFYGDFMYGTYSLKDLQLAGLNDQEVDVSDFRPFGWRLGAQWMDNLLHMRLEGGQRPGYRKKYWYVNFTIGFQLVGNERA